MLGAELQVAIKYSEEKAMHLKGSDNLDKKGCRTVYKMAIFKNIHFNGDFCQMLIWRYFAWNPSWQIQFVCY